jgi:hypothetical protein
MTARCCTCIRRAIRCARNFTFPLRKRFHLREPARARVSIAKALHARWSRVDPADFLGT